LKHATISFGQQLQPEVLQAATTLAKAADLFIVLGSSLVVEPAASLPVVAKQHGASLVIVNRDPTQLDSFADLVIHESIAATLDRTEQRLNQS
jgi:NAD-dependent deacetylase